MPNFILVVVCVAALVSPPLRADETPDSKGERLYSKNCSQCHGDDLQNNSGIAFDLRRLKADEHSRFVDSVLHGKRAMPSWDGALSLEQIESLWAYIRAHAYQQQR